MKDRLREFTERVPLEWLLSGEPWVRYRTLTDLLGKGEDDEGVAAVKALIPNHSLISAIFDRRNEDGYWGDAGDIHRWWPRKGTTFWILPMLADFGLGKDDERVSRICEYVFSTQVKSAGWGCGAPTTPYDCFTAILAEPLATMGYSGDARLKIAYEWLRNRQRADGGFWCKNSGQPGGPRAREPSCAFATMFALGAFAKNPELKRSSTAAKSVDFLLACWENRGKIKHAGHDSEIGTGWEKLKYPFTDYRILKCLDVLSQFESTREKRAMHEMIGLLIGKEDEEGRFTPESIHRVWSDFDFGQKRVPSRWITLLAYRIVRRVVGWG